MVGVEMLVFKSSGPPFHSFHSFIGGGLLG